MIDETAYKKLLERALAAEKQCRSLEDTVINLNAKLKVALGQVDPGEIYISEICVRRHRATKHPFNYTSFTVEVNKTEDGEHIDMMLKILRERIEQWLRWKDVPRKPKGARRVYRTP